MNEINEKKFWLNVEALILDLLNKSKPLLDSESIGAVQHYINHSEYEMAFEGLFIELMKCDDIPSDIEWEMYLKLGIQFGLDTESVFDADFWSRFSVFIEEQISGSP